ncbi:MAG: nuclease, partial [Alphaproteobacteria bacterium]|nr:nuclease [Alphaproteobacteria bacterium]
MRFMGCVHATRLDLMHLRGEGPEPGEDTEDAAPLQKQGDAHEAAHLEKLKSSGKAVLEIPRSDLVADAHATKTALALGTEVVFQGAFLSGNWGGWSDFLLRVDRPSSLGPFSYEVADTKLKRRPHPKHVL